MIKVSFNDQKIGALNVLEVLHNAKGRDDSPTEVVLSKALMDAIVQAKEGNAKAWGTLYAAAAAFMRGGHPLPAPLQEAIAPRLEALGKALMKPPKQDARAGVLDAVSPYPKAVRPVGAKTKAMTVDKVAEDVLAYVAAGMTQKAAARKVSSLLPLKPETGKPLYSPESLESAAKRIKKQQKSGGK
jgi:hypothetical protein